MSLVRSLAILLMAATLAACGGKLGEIYPEAVSARLFARSYERDHDVISEVGALSPDRMKRLRRDIHAESEALITPLASFRTTSSACTMRRGRWSVKSRFASAVAESGQAPSYRRQ